MFDCVTGVEVDCPLCGSKVDSFQSKDGLCLLEPVDPLDLYNFYALCKCGAWIEFNRPLPPPVRTRATSLDDFAMTVNA